MITVLCCLPARRRSLARAGLWFDTISALLLSPQDVILLGLNGVSILAEFYLKLVFLVVIKDGLSWDMAARRLFSSGCEWPR